MRLAFVIALAALSACSPRPFIAESRLPSEARIRELARMDRPVAIPERTDLEIQVMPAVILAGTSAWVRCLVPYRPEHRWLQYGIALRRTSVAQLDGARAALFYETLIERIGCGTWTAFCQTTDAADHHETRTVALTARGDCNSGDPGDPR